MNKDLKKRIYAEVKALEQEYKRKQSEANKIVLEMVDISSLIQIKLEKI